MIFKYDEFGIRFLVDLKTITAVTSPVKGPGGSARFQILTTGGEIPISSSHENQTYKVHAAITTAWQEFYQKGRVETFL